MKGKKDQVLDKGTEERILATAREVFLVRGKNGARMDEIAREAGVNKALLHYYYRSKDNIFRAVFKLAAGEMLKAIAGRINFELPLRELLDDFVHHHIGLIKKNRMVMQFFFSEVWMNRDEVLPLFREVLQRENIPVYNRFFERINQAIYSGEIRPVDPFHLLMNILSLDIFYFIAAPVFCAISDMPEARQKEMDNARADEVVSFIWESIRPGKEVQS